MLGTGRFRGEWPEVGDLGDWFCKWNLARLMG